MPTLLRLALGAIVLVYVLAIGRTARRIEERRPRPTSGLPSDAEEDIRRGWRRGAIGAVLGLGVGAAIIAALGVALAADSTVFDVQTALIGVSFAFLGAALGMLTASLRLSRRMRDELGSDSGSARRIGRAVAGKGGELTPDEQASAARYAVFATQWVPFQLTSSLLLLIGIASQQLGGVLDDARVEPFRLIIVGIVLLAFLIALPMGAVRIRRLRAYAAAHPVPAP